MSQKKKKQFTVQVKMELVLDVDVSATSLEEAVAAGRDLKVTDVVDLSGVGYNDGSIEVTGVFG